MSERDRDLMERYIYQVAKRVPREQRREIAMELQELIEDMAEATSMEQALHKLGDPAEFARQYQDSSRYVISPEYFDNYQWVLKIVMIAVWVSVIVSGIIQGVTSGRYHLIVWEIIENFITSSVTAFGMVTLVFAVLERQHVNVDLIEKKQWSVEKLAAEPDLSEKAGVRTKSWNAVKSWTPDFLLPVPDKKSLIQRSDTVVSIVFTVILCGIFVFAPELMGAYIMEDGDLIRTIPLFNLKSWNVLLPILLVCFLASFLDDMVRLVVGCYGRVVLASTAIMGGIQLILFTIVFKFMPIWNVHFAEEVRQAFGKGATSRGDMLYYFGTDIFSNAILAFMYAVIFLEIGFAAYRTVRYGVEKSR